MPGTRTVAETTEMTPDEALLMLKEGNVRFLNDLAYPRDPYEDLDKTKSKQWPFAAIVSCMDSRVSTKLVFNLGVGDLFSLRMAGNVVTDGIIGSLEYATAVVGTKLIVVMGHSGCGAVKGACEDVQLGHLTEVLQAVQPAVRGASGFRGPRQPDNPDYLQAVAELNAQMGARRVVERSAVIRDLVHRGKVKVVPAMYDIATGHVLFMDDVVIK